MDISTGDGTCIVDNSGIIVWASPTFIELFSHRISVVGTPFNQIFQSMGIECKPGATFEDRDKLGRKRFFKTECMPMTNAKGEKVSDMVTLLNVTLMKTLIDISRYSSQAKSPKEFFEKILWVIKDAYGYLALAGFIARDDTLELVASKSWTEKLKSIIGVQPIAPDSLGLAGRSTYHKRQMVTPIKQYSLLPTAKTAIERIGGEYVVVTPLIDHDRLTGALTVFHGREMSPSDFDTLQTLCNHIAVLLNMHLQQEELREQAEDSELYLDLLAHNILDNDGLMLRCLKQAGPGGIRSCVSDMENAIKRNDEQIGLIKGISQEKIVTPVVTCVDEAVHGAVYDAREYSAASGKSMNFKYTPYGEANVMGGPLLNEAIYNILTNSIKNTASDTIDIEIKLAKDRSGLYRLEIADNSKGIPDEYKSEVFRKKRGSESGHPYGSALYLVKMIVNRYGGRVWVEDRIPGNPARGTRVVLSLLPENKTQ